jgi:DNA-binding response OmpR family regulator
MEKTTPSVLVVDDEELVRWALGQRLVERGYRVLQASSARSAVALSMDADLVLLEETLPDSDGRQLALQLRSERPERPIIVMTAYTSPELEKLVRSGTVDAVVEKPFALEDMLQLIRAFLHAA